MYHNAKEEQMARSTGKRLIFRFLLA